MQRRAAALALELESFRQALIAAGGDAPDPALVKIIAVPLCKLVKMTIPNAHQKLDEVVFGAENGLDVQEHQHGADLKDADGNSFELKVSVCTKKNRKCNFNWNIPRGKIAEVRRFKLLASVREKTGGGGAILRVVDAFGALIAEFKFSEAFLLAYFNRLAFGASGNHNLGCTRCRTCDGFHRLEKLRGANDIFALAEPWKVDWTAVFAPTAAHC